MNCKSEWDSVRIARDEDDNITKGILRRNWWSIRRQLKNCMDSTWLRKNTYWPECQKSPWKLTCVCEAPFRENRNIERHAEYRQCVWRRKFFSATNWLLMPTFSRVHRSYSESLLAIACLKKQVSEAIAQGGRLLSVMQFQDSFRDVFLSYICQNCRSIRTIYSHSMRLWRSWKRMTSELLMKLTQK
jgi:hypothetical protein